MWLAQTRHPIFPLIPARETVVDPASPIDAPILIDWKAAIPKREAYLELEKKDPWNYVFVPPHWELATRVLSQAKELMVAGGNRSGKTLWAGRECVKSLVSKEGANVLCCHSSSKTSITVQQPAIYNFLPYVLKATKKGKIHYLNYSRKNGFTDGSFILPNGARCDFLNYTQNPDVIEGREADLIWCDELVPQEWIDTLRFRLHSRRGKLIVTQTPIEGIASVFKEFVAGGSVIEWGDAELLAGRRAFPEWPEGKAPRVLHGAKETRKTVFFFTKDNPFNPYEEMVNEVTGAPVTQILVRAYGWACDNSGKAFPRFKKEVHVVPRSKIPEGGTLYKAVDPAGSRNWFTIWARVYDDGKIFIVREWPDYRSFGEWALPGPKPDGKKGPAQDADAARSYSAYRALYRDIEEALGETPIVNFIDPASGGTPSIAEEGGRTLIDLLEYSDDPDDPPMPFTPAAKVPVHQRHATINDHLSYDQTAPLTPLNEPRLYISEDCWNLIWCLIEHTGLDGQKGASKDPIDCLGMLLCSDAVFIPEGGLVSVGGGSY